MDLARSARSVRLWVWVIPWALYALFWLWYTPLSGPLTEDEVDAALARAESTGFPAESLQTLREFLSEDDGRSFIMVNILDLEDDPAPLPATGPDADASDLLDHYMEYMYPALLSRASHPVFAGASVANSLDLVGIEGAEQWGTAALMRYRSRRDLIEISSNPIFGERHDYKVGALEKTVAFPVAPQLFLSDLRLILFLALLSVLSVVDLLIWRRG